MSNGIIKYFHGARNYNINILIFYGGDYLSTYKQARSMATTVSGRITTAGLCNVTANRFCDPVRM